jgi:23S rRNA pseudouridine2457 synthase
MAKLILFNKPFGVLSQFTDAKSDDESRRETLANYIDIPNIYPAGRLDKDSEGLLLLTDDGILQQRIADPEYKFEKHYWVQIDGEINDESLQALCRGVTLKDGATLPAEATRINEPEALWERTPPIRFRKSIPTRWLNIIIREGRNRQVRRMTAAVNHPTLRLIRHQIGPWDLTSLSPGQHKQIQIDNPNKLSING